MVRMFVVCMEINLTGGSTALVVAGERRVRVSVCQRCWLSRIFRRWGD